MLADASDREHEILRAIPVPGQRGGAARRPPAAPAPPPRLGELELPPAGRAEPGDPRDLPHEPPPVARRRPRVLRDAQPHRRDRSRARDPAHDRLRAPGLHGGGRSPRRRATTRSAAATGRTSAAPTGAGASTRTASASARGWRSGFGARAAVSQRRLRGHDPPPPRRGPPPRAPPPDRDGLSRPRRASAAARRPAARPPAGRPALPAPRLPRRRRRPACRRGARRRRRAGGKRARRPGPGAVPPAHVRPLLQPGELLLLLRPRRSGSRPSSPR